jgi:hypothetical protein
MIVRIGYFYTFIGTVPTWYGKALGIHVILSPLICKYTGRTHGQRAFVFVLHGNSKTARAQHDASQLARQQLSSLQRPLLQQLLDAAEMSVTVLPEDSASQQQLVLKVAEHCGVKVSAAVQYTVGQAQLMQLW